MQKRYGVILFMILLLIPGTYAGNPHVLWGYCSDGHEGTSAAGSTVSIYLEGNENETLTTTVGDNRAYNIDASGFSEWNIGDILVLKIKKEGCYAGKTIVMDGAGAQRIDNLALTCPEPEFQDTPDTKPRKSSESDNLSVDNVNSTPVETQAQAQTNTTTNESPTESFNPVQTQSNESETTDESKSSVTNESTVSIPEKNKPSDNTGDIKNETLQKKEDGSKNHSGMYGPSFIIITSIIALLLFLIVFTIFKKKKKKPPAQENITQKQVGQSKINALPELTSEEVKILKILVSDALSENELSHKIGYGASYTLEKLMNRDIIYFNDENKAHIRVWAKPKFMFEHIFDKKQQDIVMFLKSAGEVTQSDISKKTGIPRNTISRKLDDLEKIEVIERHIMGAYKNVKLKQWFRENL